MPPPGCTIISKVKLLIYQSIETEYEEEDIVGKYVDCYAACLRSQQKLQTQHIRRTFVAGADKLSSEESPLGGSIGGLLRADGKDSM
jgi:hypothetical protein